jgi:hypothetical protein
VAGVGGVFGGFAPVGFEVGDVGVEFGLGGEVGDGGRVPGAEAPCFSVGGDARTEVRAYLRGKSNGGSSGKSNGGSSGKRKGGSSGKCNGGDSERSSE